MTLRHLLQSQRPGPPQILSPTSKFHNSPLTPADILNPPRLAPRTSSLGFHILSSVVLGARGSSASSASSSSSIASALGRLPARTVERSWGEAVEGLAYFRGWVGASRGERASGVMPLPFRAAEWLCWSLASTWRWERQHLIRSTQF